MKNDTPVKGSALLLAGYTGAFSFPGAANGEFSKLTLGLYGTKGRRRRPFVAVPSIVCGDATHTRIRDGIVERFAADPLLRDLDTSVAYTRPGDGAFPVGGTWPSPRKAKVGLASLIEKQLQSRLSPEDRLLAIAALEVMIPTSLASDFPDEPIRLRKRASACLPTGAKDEPFRHISFGIWAENSRLIRELIVANEMTALLHKCGVMFGFYPVVRSQTTTTHEVTEAVEGVLTKRRRWRKKRMVMTVWGKAELADDIIPERLDMCRARDRPANGEPATASPGSRIIGVRNLKFKMRTFAAFKKGGADFYNAVLARKGCRIFIKADVRNQDSTMLEELNYLYHARNAFVWGFMGEVGAISMHAPMFYKEPTTGEATRYGDPMDITTFDTWCLTSGSGETADMVHSCCAILKATSLNKVSRDRLFRLKEALRNGRAGYEALKLRIARWLNQDCDWLGFSLVSFLGGDNFGIGLSSDPYGLSKLDELPNDYAEVPYSDTYMGYVDINKTDTVPGSPLLILNPVKGAMWLWPGRDYYDEKRNDSLKGVEERSATFSSEGETGRRAIVALEDTFLSVLKMNMYEWAAVTSAANPKPPAVVDMEPINAAEMKFAETGGDYYYYGDTSQVRPAFVDAFFGAIRASEWHATAKAMMATPILGWFAYPNEWGISAYSRGKTQDYGIFDLQTAGDRNPFIGIKLDTNEQFEGDD